MDRYKAERSRRRAIKFDITQKVKTFDVTPEQGQPEHAARLHLETLHILAQGSASELTISSELHPVPAELFK